MDPLLQLTIAWALAALFAGSTLHKLLASSEWPGVVRNYRVVPEATAAATAAALLCAGALTSVALVWTPSRRIGACAAALQLALFGAALGINLARGRTHIDCGCFGSRLREGISRWMIARNALLVLMALTLLLPARSRELSPVEFVVAFFCVATLAFLYPVVAVVLQPDPPTYDENYRTSAAPGAS